MKYLVLVFILFTYGSTDPIIASYGIQPELYWLEGSEYTYETLSEDVGYSAIYYDPISNQYYITLIEETNNISYDTNNIIDEQNFFDYKQITPKLPLTYIGSINLTNRVYIDTNNNQYIKKLEFINDSYYYDYDNKQKELLSPVYPYVSQHYEIEYNKFEYIFYSNKNMNFQRVSPIGILVKIKPF